MLLGDLGTDRRRLFTYWASEVGRAESHDHLIPQVGHDVSAVWTAGEAGPRRRWIARHT
jgi:hypothetical protein